MCTARHLPAFYTCKTGDVLLVSKLLGHAKPDMLKVAESPKKLHIIAADDTGTAEKNIINKDLGILDDFGILVEYNGSGTKDDKIPHLILHTGKGDKVIYVLGYG